VRLARAERRTKSNFVINLIHERQAQLNREAAQGKAVGE